VVYGNKKPGFWWHFFVTMLTKYSPCLTLLLPLLRPLIYKNTLSRVWLLES